MVVNAKPMNHLRRPWVWHAVGSSTCEALPCMKSRARQMTLLQWVLVFGVWTLIGLTFGAQLYLAYSRSRQPISWTKALFLELTYWYLVGILSPAILWLARKFRIDRQRWLSSLLVHIAAGGLFSFVHSAIYLFISLSISD